MLIELLRLEHGIFVAIAQVLLETGHADAHAIVWDAWRRVLFIGPDAFDDKVCDGAILVDAEEIADPNRRCEVHIGLDQHKEFMAWRTRCASMTRLCDAGAHVAVGRLRSTCRPPADLGGCSWAAASARGTVAPHGMLTRLCMATNWREFPDLV